MCTFYNAYMNLLITFRIKMVILYSMHSLHLIFRAMNQLQVNANDAIELKAK